MNFFGNLSLRRSQRLRCNNKSLSGTSTNENDSNSMTLDGTTDSMPNISDCENDEVRELKLEIDKLNLELKAAHETINKLSIENMDLKKTATDGIKCNTMISTPGRSSKQSTPKNKKQWKKLKIPQFSKENTQHNMTSVCTTPIALTSTNCQNTQSIPKTELSSQKRKLCIISSNKQNKLLSIAEDKFEDFQLCHYLTPYCGIQTLIKNLNMKLTDYSKEDYCIILIGDEDFNKAKNYTDLIVHIRETLFSIQHTNVILCLPTYKYKNFSQLFNCRIEMFNNLLYSDIQAHKYVTLFDTNFDLSADYTMFSRRHGSLNNNGMLNVLNNLEKLVNEQIFRHTEKLSSALDTSDSLNTSTICANNNTFFRP